MRHQNEIAGQVPTASERPPLSFTDGEQAVQGGHIRPKVFLWHGESWWQRGFGPSGFGLLMGIISKPTTNKQKPGINTKTGRGELMCTEDWRLSWDLFWVQTILRSILNSHWAYLFGKPYGISEILTHFLWNVFGVRLCWGMVPGSALVPPELDLLGSSLPAGHRGALPTPDRMVEAFPGIAWLVELALVEELVSLFGYKPSAKPVWWHL